MKCKTQESEIYGREGPHIKSRYSIRSPNALDLGASAYFFDMGKKTDGGG